MLIFLIMSCTFALTVRVNPSAFKSFTFFSSHPKFPHHVSPFYHPQMFRTCVLHVPASAAHNLLFHSAHVNSAPSGHGSLYAKLSNVIERLETRLADHLDNPNGVQNDVPELHQRVHEHLCRAIRAVSQAVGQLRYTKLALYLAFSTTHPSSH